MPRKLDLQKLRYGSELIKRGFASMQKGGVIMDVTDAKQAMIAEEAGAVAVMALERVPADIRAAGGVARMADPLKIKEIMDAVTIPVMAKCRIGHFAEAQVLEALGVDMIDESEVLTPADPFFHVDKSKFKVPFVCGARDLGQAVRRIAEGAAMIRTKGEAGTGNVIEAVRHQRLISQMIHDLKMMDKDEFETLVKSYCDPFARLEVEVRSGWSSRKVAKNEIIFGGLTYAEWEKRIREILLEVKRLQRLPVVNFAAGGIATPADAALMMQLGSDGVFVGSGIFKSSNPKGMARAIVEAVNHYDEPEYVAEVSRGLGEPMPGIEIPKLAQEQRMQERGV
jgi:pyridoxal 5'-phosphate synthase pdxS subunit